jgi:hypothetical protein
MAWEGNRDYFMWKKKFDTRSGKSRIEILC